MDKGESHRIQRGSIPGAAGACAFTFTGTGPSAIPVLIAVPHAGRIYPADLLERMRHPAAAALKLEDRYVDSLAKEVACLTGAQLLVANAPRAMIDLNRAVDDVDWDMFCQQGAATDIGSYTPSRRARSGLGLIPRRVPGLGELWKRRHDRADLAVRIAEIHEPYHACLAQALQVLRRRWGAALLLDLHSMPPLPSQASQPAPELVLGDRYGVACDGGLVASAFAYFSESGRRVAHNRPYAGGYVLERHAAPEQGLHAFQLEIDRSLYLDRDLDQPGEGFSEMARLLSGLVRRLAAEVAALGPSGHLSGLADAAE